MNSYLPRAINKLADALAELPSLGPRQAIRLSIFVTQRGQHFINQLVAALQEANQLKICSDCFFLHDLDSNLCLFCSDVKRDKSTIAIVEKETDLISMENTHKYRGRYFIIGQV